MKNTLTSRIFLAGFALSFLMIASRTEAQPGVQPVNKPFDPTTLYLKRTDGGANLVAKSATIGANGSFTFTNVPAGKYELLISGTESYFAAKAAETNNLITIDFDWASTSSMNKTLISTSKSNIKHNGIAGPGGSGGDSTIKDGRGHTVGDGGPGSAINTSRSNLKHQGCPIKPSDVTSANVGGRTVYTSVLLTDIEITGDSSPSGTITNFAIKENGVK